MEYSRSSVSQRGAQCLVLIAVLCLPLSSALANWPQWLGSNGDLTAPPVDRVFGSWPAGGITRVWESAEYSGYNTYGSLIAAQGRVYVLEGSNTVVCLDSDEGSEIWRSNYLGEGTVHGTPCVHEGRIYAPLSSGSSTLTCLEGDGTIRWAVTNVGANVDSSPIPAGGLIVMNAPEAKGYDPETGAVVWSNIVGNWRSSAGVWKKDGTEYVLIGGVGETTCADAATGAIAWQIPIDSFESTPTVYGDYAILSDWTNAYCISMTTTNATIEWSKSLTQSSSSSHCIHQGYAYVAGFVGMDCYDLYTGELQWSVVGDSYYASPIAGNGVIFWAPGRDTFLRALRGGPDGGTLGIFDSERYGLQTPIIYDGKLIARRPDGSVTAFDISAPAPAITEFDETDIELDNGFSNGLAAIEFRTNLLNGSWLPAGAVFTSNVLTRTVAPSNAYANVFYRVVAADISDAPEGMILVPAGSFLMGDTFEDTISAWGERPTHEVYLSSFYMSEQTVTKALWDEVYSWATARPVELRYEFDNNASGKGPDHPAHSVNWYDVIKWCNARSEKEGLTPAYYTTTNLTTVFRTGQVDLVSECVIWNNGGYRIPTEAEWEKAARGGFTGRRFPWGNTIDHSHANYQGNPTMYNYDLGYAGYDQVYYDGINPNTCPTDAFERNGYGIYGMAGNAWQWCWDEFDPNWYTDPGAVLPDTRGPSILTSVRSARGGAWDQDPIYSRCATRYSLSMAMACNCSQIRCVRAFPEN
jgi:sulfatase modifying factor 1